ncbi:MAG: DUF4367 domain-containing protein [Ignavibacteriales bacterium]
MDQFDIVKQFNEDVDSILAGKLPTKDSQGEIQPDDLLSLAVILAETNPIPENQQKQALRRQLIERRLAKNTTKNDKEAIMQNFFEKHRSQVLAGAFAFIALLGFFTIFPGTFGAMAKSIGSILKIGAYVTLYDDTAKPDKSTISPLTADQKAQLDKNGYLEYTDKNGNQCVIGTWGEPPVDKVNYSSLTDAQKGVSYTLLAPKYLPEGYSFKNAECFKDSKEYITLNFQGAGKDIILMQRLMNEQTKYETGGKIVPVLINGNDGAWVDSALTWEKDGVNYTLFAKGFSKNEIQKIAESI